MSLLIISSANLRPISRLVPKKVLRGLIEGCCLAVKPTCSCPRASTLTTEGILRDPSGLLMTTRSPALLTTEAAELEVPLLKKISNEPEEI